jgi:hypothetical protein
MTHTARRLLIVVAWGLSLVAVWLLIPRPPHDDEYRKWFFFSVFEFGVPWFLDLSLMLWVAFSLERRCGRTRYWILGVWTATVVGLIWLHIFRPASLGPFDTYNTYPSWLLIGIQVFAMRELFPLLVALCIALWLEGRIAERSALTKSGPYQRPLVH